jgi:nicotinamide-nucleotide adenylyltransferase
MKVGVILARLQPVHNGHLALIFDAARSCDKVVVLVGSADKFDKRNPIPISIRMQMLKEAIQDQNWIPEVKDKIEIHPLDDLTTESDNSHEWGFYLYSKVVSIIDQANFTIFYSDGFEIITTWFPGYILRNNVSLALMARNSCESGVSATLVRQLIINDDPELENYVPESVASRRSTLKELINLANKVSK